MSKRKWMRTDPDTIKIGDEVRHDNRYSSVRGKVTQVDSESVVVARIIFMKDSDDTKWFIRKPKKSKLIERPDEPTVGCFFRVSGSPDVHYRWREGDDGYYLNLETADCWESWESLAEPGDTITLLKLVPIGGETVTTKEEYAANVASIKAECDAGEHRGPEGPNEDLAQCPLCWSVTFSRRPDGETFGNHTDECSLPSEHLSFCVSGGSGHPPASKARGWG